MRILWQCLGLKLLAGGTLTVMAVIGLGAVLDGLPLLLASWCTGQCVGVAVIFLGPPVYEERTYR